MKKRFKKIRSKWAVGEPARRLHKFQLTSPQLFVGSFLSLIVLGAIGFKVLPGLYQAEPLTWLDAFFTSTSAVCVTGLSVVDISKVFTFWGQAFLLLLIQLGGLGMLSFASMIILAFGGRISLRQDACGIVQTDSAPTIDRRKLLADIFRFTMLFELIGSIALYLAWVPKFGWVEAIWPAIFHSVSAFCNAGFSTFSDSLIGFQTSPFVLLIIAGLIVAGSLGFLAHEELWIQFRSNRKRAAFRLSLQTRLVLVTSACLILVGWGFYIVFEWDHTLRLLNSLDKIVNAFFMSVTARTAGFNAVDYGQVSDSSLLLTLLLMSIGGSPGSTAGGIKTTTFAVIGLVAWSRLQGLESTTCWGRSIPEGTTSRAIGLVVIMVAVLIVGIFLLTMASPILNDGLVDQVFEATSAINTVGLSTGVTAQLTATGRIVIILLMFFGRIGMLTMAAALTLPRSTARGFRYSYEDVVVG